MARAYAPHRFVLAVSLFVLAPLTGEWLLGNQPVTALPSLFLLAPMYGGGALLVREAARRTGRGWPTMVLLAAAYALYEEGPVDQMLWNPHYGGQDMASAYAGPHLPVLDTSASLLQDVLSLHTVWSICVPIAIVESFSRQPARPWLGNVGLPVVGALFLGGTVFLASEQVSSEHFGVFDTRFVAALVLIVLLVALAFVVGRHQRPRTDTAVPPPWLAGVLAFAATSLYWCRDFVPESFPRWPILIGWCVLVAAAVLLCLRWSRSRRWTGGHRLALAGGALLTYAWVGFDQGRYLPASPTVRLVGSTVLAVGAVALLGAAVLFRSRRREALDQP